MILIILISVKLFLIRAAALTRAFGDAFNARTAVTSPSFHHEILFSSCSDKRTIGSHWYC